MPAVPLALFVAGGCVALVLDQLWLISARRELQAAADAGALAGAAQIAVDQLLADDFDRQARADDIRHTAAETAAMNRAAGRPVFVDPAPSRDVRLGQIVVNAQYGLPQFLENDLVPTSVLVTARSDRRRGNPVTLFFAALTGRAAADVVARAEASVDNHIVGVRPLPKAPVPAWPLGILEFSMDLERTDTWVLQIEQRLGDDRYGFDPRRREILTESDGIPEIRVILPHASRPQPGNACLIDVGTGLYDARLMQQFQSGWTEEDCRPFGDQLLLGNGAELELAALAVSTTSVAEILKQQIGQARIIVLYQDSGSPDDRFPGRVIARRFAAARLMHVAETADGTELILQPAVIATRTALTGADFPLTAPSERGANRYIYRLSLTY